MRAIDRRRSVFVGALALAVSVSSVAQIRAQDALSPAAPEARRVDLAESILAAKERALGEPFEARVRAALKSRMEMLPVEQLSALAQLGEGADLPSVLGSVTSDLVYTPVTPCRAFDSRPSQGGPGPIPANTQRNVFIVGTVGFEAQGGLAGGCGVPVGATSAIINLVTVLPAGPGNIRAWAVANPQPPAPLAAILNYGSVTGLPAIANGVAVPLCNPAATDCSLGDLRLQADTSATNILGDVVGYFGPAVGNFVDLSTAQTVAGSKTFSSPIVGSVTGSAASVTGIVPIVNGGTGSATQNFVDLTTAQTIGGNKTLTGNLDLGSSTATTGNVLRNAIPYIHSFGAFNTFVGENAGNLIMTGSLNTGLGANALANQTTGSSNTAIGADALGVNTIGNLNTATGSGALRFNTTGGGNTANGQNALENNTGGGNNTATGWLALASNAFGSGNSASGKEALRGNTNGNNNTASGQRTLLENTTGGGNTASGSNALQSNTTGSFNSALGRAALFSNTLGNSNVAIGSGADVGAGDLSNAIAIGANAVVSQSNSLVLGSNVNVGIGTTAPAYKLHVVGETVRVEGNTASVLPRFSLNFTGGGVDQKKWQMYATTGVLSFTALNDAENSETGWLQVNRGAGTSISGVAIPNGNVAIGIASTPDRLGVNGTISVAALGSAGATALCRNASNQISTCSSSSRYKSNIDSFNAGLTLIKQLHPVSFNWREGGMADMGLVAEEVSAVEPLLTTTNESGQVEGVKYDRVAVVLVNAIKEQQAQLEALERRNLAQQMQIERLMKIVCPPEAGADACSAGTVRE